MMVQNEDSYNNIYVGWYEFRKGKLISQKCVKAKFWSRSGHMDPQYGWYGFTWYISCLSYADLVRSNKRWEQLPGYAFTWHLQQFSKQDLIVSLLLSYLSCLKKVCFVIYHKGRADFSKSKDTFLYVLRSNFFSHNYGFQLYTLNLVSERII